MDKDHLKTLLQQVRDGALEIDDAVGAPKQGDGGTDFYTRRVVAVIAAQHGKMSPRIRIVSLLDVFHPSPVYADGDVVFFLARHRARMAADALAQIDDKPVVRHHRGL